MQLCMGINLTKNETIKVIALKEVMTSIIIQIEELILKMII